MNTSPRRRHFSRMHETTRSESKNMAKLQSYPYLNGYKHQNGIDSCHLWEPISALGCHANQRTVCDDGNNTEGFKRRLKNNYDRPAQINGSKLAEFT